MTAPMHRKKTSWGGATRLGLSAVHDGMPAEEAKIQKKGSIADAGTMICCSRGKKVVGNRSARKKTKVNGT